MSERMCAWCGGPIPMGVLAHAHFNYDAPEWMSSFCSFAHWEKVAAEQARLAAEVQKADRPFRADLLALFYDEASVEILMNGENYAVELSLLEAGQP